MVVDRRLTDGLNELKSLFKFLVGQLNFTEKRVCMAHKSVDDLLQSSIVRIAHCLQYDFSNRVRVVNDTVEVR